MPTEIPFDAEDFLKRLTLSKLNTHMTEELNKLSYEQLTQVALLMETQKNDAEGETTGKKGKAPRIAPNAF